jgi:hypothetical protein
MRIEEQFPLLTSLTAILAINFTTAWKFTKTSPYREIMKETPPAP